QLPDLGPLQGLADGLQALQGRAEAAFVSACDVPLLVPALVERLVTSLADCQVAVPVVGGRYHPLAAVYRVDVVETARNLLAANRRRLLDLLDAVRTRCVTAAELADVDPTFRSLANLNTPQDYVAAAAGR
ncbi:MAG: molybdenum cofactor guanylyltransferase, partial [Gemmataceae bacterium]|nr:molybdenum cofactor guanylyltransferase [Gemmataceae bacterium]